MTDYKKLNNQFEKVANDIFSKIADSFKTAKDTIPELFEGQPEISSNRKYDFTFIGEEYSINAIPLVTNGKLCFETSFMALTDPNKERKYELLSELTIAVSVDGYDPMGQAVLKYNFPNKENAEFYFLNKSDVGEQYVKHIWEYIKRKQEEEFKRITTATK